MLERCRQLPSDVRLVCETRARNRYQRHYHPSNPLRKRHIAVDAGMALALVLVFAFAAYITLYYRQAVQHQNIEMSIQTSAPAVASGDVLSGTIEVRNNGSQSLLGSYLTVPTSVGFVLSHSVPSIDEQGRIALGTIKPGKSATVTVDGYVIAESSSSARMNAVLHYRLPGFDEESEKFVSESVYISGSSFVLDAKFPNSIAANIPFDFEISYANTSQVTNFTNVAIVPTFPPNWETVSSNPINDPATDSWTIDSVGSLQSGSIVGRARLRATTVTSADVKLQLYASLEGTPLLQDEVKMTLPVFYPRVTVTAALVPTRVSLGETIEAIIDITNNESFDLQDPVVYVKADSFLIDISGYEQVEWTDGFLSLRQDVMPAGSKRQVIVRLPLRKEVNASPVFGNNPVVFELHGELEFKNEKSERIIVPIDGAQAQVNSDLGIKATSRYYSPDGEALGTGPLPPVVGETTTYWVFLQAENQLHRVRDVVITARLGEQAVWQDRGSVGAGEPLVYDENSRTLTWSVGNLPDYKTAYDKNRLGAALQLSVTPTAQQLGERLILLEDIRISGIDTVTGSRLQAVVDDVTTELKFDANTKDDGRVVM